MITASKMHVLSLLLLGLCATSGYGLKCYQCSYYWAREYNADQSYSYEISYGTSLCATDPKESVIGITSVNCTRNQVCAALHALGENHYDDPEDGPTDMEVVAVARACIDKQQEYPDSCYYTNDFTDLRPPYWDDGVKVDPSSEVCQCETDNCNNKKYKSAASQLHMSALWIVAIMAVYFK